jgi:hypothetical protein
MHPLTLVAIPYLLRVELLKAKVARAFHLTPLERPTKEHLSHIFATWPECFAKDIVHSGIALLKKVQMWSRNNQQVWSKFYRLNESFC